MSERFILYIGGYVPTVEVTMNLPFYLRLKTTVSVSYDEVCRDSHLSELSGQNIQITFTPRSAKSIDKSGSPYSRTTIKITLKTRKRLPDATIDTFAIQNCLEILNRVVTSYQATTGEISNAGFIFPLGTADMQLFADIRVNKKDIRDRWPGYSINTFPLGNEKIEEFMGYLDGSGDLPLSRLFLTNAGLSLNSGQYHLAVLQGATAVELRITQFIVDKLKTAGYSDKAIEPYEKMPLGSKLDIPQTDPRSLETYFSGVNGFEDVYKKAKLKLTKLRNDIIHRGYLAFKQEAIEAVQIARDFLNIVN